jgi:hypothetical protein
MDDKHLEHLNKKYFRKNKDKLNQLPVEGLSSIQLVIIDGYFFVNQRKKAGTPILKNQTKNIIYNHKIDIKKTAGKGILTC